MLIDYYVYRECLELSLILEIGRLEDMSRALISVLAVLRSF
jgi:hypothetical protein